MTAADDDNWDDTPDDWPRSLAYDTRQNMLTNAKRFLMARPSRLIVSNKIVYSLRDGLWHEQDDSDFASEIQATNEPGLALDVNDVYSLVAAIKLMRHSKARPFEWIDRPATAPDARNMILFGNGLLDFKTKKMRKHDGSFFATACPNFDYDPKAKCPRWMQALDEWFEEASDASGSVVHTLQEFFGYAMTADTSLHAILSLLGSGRAGKSTILEVLGGLCGPSHTQSRMLGDLSGEHGLEGLQDARLLIIPDAADTELSKRAVALSRIKAISGGDPVSINPKNIKIFKCKIPARIVLVANRHPKFIDDSGALAMRELPIVFTRSFQDDDDKDPDLTNKLLRELPGIANWALKGLERLRSNGRFTEGDALRRARRDLEQEQSPMLRFAARHLRYDPDGFTGPRKLFETYELWASDERLKASELRNRNQFKTDMIAACARHGVRFKRRRHPITKKPATGWFGIALR